ncbi:thiolase [Alcanivorax hongdengensis A-11-3]|uniref:Thiolase n=1 Tax=Alcanivorax hongdengensis A-11-3 TaxID=1177179 RepID=L0WAF1_9GAMM|nr:DUF6316 family protein [Alcanivorax hongdengensis]EKF73067.1 thiolase [Alcanivorax hongdengensis A-11-3]
MECRKEDEQKKLWFRSDRFFNEGGKWYFSTREETVEGPFDSRADAEQELMMYIRDIKARESFGLKPTRKPAQPGRPV